MRMTATEVIKRRKAFWKTRAAKALARLWDETVAEILKLKVK